MLQIQNISFAYQKELTLQKLSFSLEKGKNLAIIGESGCGKSTLLKLIYGLHDLNEGHIFWKEQEVLGPKFHLIPGMEYMKYLAQDFDLMPFITVAENVGKYLSNFYPEQKAKRIAELLDVVEMAELADVKTKTLSGGQMQRVALARVLALEPEVLLLDEPFSHIDNFRKSSLRRKLFAYLKDKQITTLIATHDSSDVLSFCDRVLVMRNGQILAESTPHELYETPADKYTASLFGDVNEIVINNIKVFAYPHQLQLSTTVGFAVEVISSYYKGSHYLIEAQDNKETILFENPKAIAAGTTVYLEIKNPEIN